MESEEINIVQLDAVVFPSEEKTIVVAVPKGDVYGGAHKYFITNCFGHVNGKTLYHFEKNADGEMAPKGHTIQFVQKNEDGTVVPGLQSEQLVLMLLDRHAKLNAVYPSAQYEKMKAGLEMFLQAARERVQERINRGVMGELKK